MPVNQVTPLPLHDLTNLVSLCITCVQADLVAPEVLFVIGRVQSLFPLLSAASTIMGIFFCNLIFTHEVQFTLQPYDMLCGSEGGFPESDSVCVIVFSDLTGVTCGEAPLSNLTQDS